MSAILISAANDDYIDLAHDLFKSLSVLQKAGELREGISFGLLDVGLNDANRAKLEAMKIKLAKAEVDIEFAGREAWEAKKPGYRAMTARPYLRRYFPGHDVYMWLDADSWAQTADAINVMTTAAAKSEAIHICWEQSPCYKAFFESAGMWHVYHDWYTANFSDQIAAGMALRPMLNTGVFALAAQSPVWEIWGKTFADALQNLPELTNKSFMCEQLSMNVALYLRKAPFVAMPAEYNWLTFFALPLWDKQRRLYLEPQPPYRPLSQIHLTGAIKRQVETITCTDGSVVTCPLTYSGRQAAG